MRFLIILNTNHDNIGGCMLSAGAIGKALVRKGHVVEYIFRKTNRSLFAFPQDALIHEYKRSRISFISRSYQVANILKERLFDAVITMDLRSLFHVFIGGAACRVPVIPVLAGGGGVRMTPPLHPKIIVFSEENKAMVAREWGWPSESIKVCGARLDVDTFWPLDGAVRTNPFKVAYMSRLNIAKRKAFEAFLESLSGLTGEYPEIRVEVYGAGPDYNEWVRLIAQRSLPPKVEIELMGQIAVSAEFFHSFSMVVAQGRGVLEALASGVPVAISGQEGYMGLVKLENIELFSLTNFTGRNAPLQSPFPEDVSAILEGKMDGEAQELSRLIRRRYSVDVFAETVLDIISSERDVLIPAGGNRMRATYRVVEALLRAGVKRPKLAIQRAISS